MMPFLIGGAGQVIRSADIFPSEACDIAIANSVTVTSLTSVSAADQTEKFVVPSMWIDRVGAGFTLDLILSHKNNEGTARAITLDALINSTSVLYGATSTIATSANTRACLLRVQLRRAGSTTGFIVFAAQIGGAGSQSGSGAPIGDFTAGTLHRCHNTAAPFPAVGSSVTIKVTATLAVASPDLTLSVIRRRLFVW